VIPTRSGPGKSNCAGASALANHLRDLHNAHVHVDNDNYLEVNILRDRAGALQKMVTDFRGLKGIHKG
jgi:metal-responsive CopG/Arc/MetJ family transcriptional regulator